MDDNKNDKKEIWIEPKLYIIDFKDTKGGSSPSAGEDLHGTISTLPG